MIDVNTEKLIPLGEVIRLRLIPPARNGRQLHYSTLIRWIVDGVRGPSGERVRLGGKRIGSRWLTSREAIQRFADALTPSLDSTPQSTPTPTPARRHRAAERAGKVLQELGI
jgi:hypothetical protein